MLKDRTAVITGGGRGIGRAIAIAMADAGARVAVASRTRAEVEQTVSLIADRGGHALAVKADVTDAGDLANLVKTVEMRFGVPDILVNNAGITGPVVPLKDISAVDFDLTLAVNLKGMLLAARAVIPGMIKKRRGKIINVTSGLAEFVIPRLGAYAISKAAVNSFTRVLARELEDYNIQVYGLDPGTVDTGMQEALRALDVNTIGPEGYRIFRMLKAGGQLRDPAEAAGLAVFLASEEADGLSGETGTEDHFMQWGYRKAA